MKATELLPATEYNLDAMQTQELWNIHNAISFHLRSAAKQLFPGQSKGIIQAAKDVKNYAANKATAMALRMDGDISEAMRYEAICDRIYKDMPSWAKGW